MNPDPSGPTRPRLLVITDVRTRLPLSMRVAPVSPSAASALRVPAPNSTDSVATASGALFEVDSTTLDIFLAEVR